MMSGESPRERIVGLLRRPRTPLLLAPMAALTHAGLRTLVDELGGCDLHFSEMISAEGLTRSTPYERYYTSELPDGERLIFQLVGYSHARIVDAAAKLAESGAAGIDVNMGCSAPHIVRKGGGIAWMSDASRAAALLRDLRDAVGEKSLSVKLRLGTTDEIEPLVRLCRGLEEAGADFVTLHPKRRNEGSARRARWSYVARLRDELTIPVVGNGGVADYATLCTRLEQGGPGPVMIGRAAARAPWIFRYLSGRIGRGAVEYRVDLLSVADRFFELLEEHQPADFHPTRARRFLPYFTANLAFGHSLGARLAQEGSYERAKAEIRSYFREHPDARDHVERT
ncbi:MAG: tRNA-dihydrouridine synthase family protein [Spirochaetota bacterium]